MDSGWKNAKTTAWIVDGWMDGPKNGATNRQISLGIDRPEDHCKGLLYGFKMAF